jgi:hypothetical protein
MIHSRFLNTDIPSLDFSSDVDNAIDIIANIAMIVNVIKNSILIYFVLGL